MTLVRKYLREKVGSNDYHEVFLLLWYGAMIAHLDSRGYVGLRLVLGGLCFLGIFFTRSQILFAAIAILQIATCWQGMPSVDNHWVFAAFINSSLLIYWGAGRLNGSQFALNAIERSFPTIRSLVLSLYCLALFHKLNWGFLNPEVSCAVVHVKGNVWAGFPAVGKIISEYSVVRYALIYGTLSVEFFIPSLLATKKYRWLGISLGVLFHLATRMRSFPSIMFSLYFLFLSEAEFAQIKKAIAKISPIKISFLTAFRLHVCTFSIWVFLSFKELDPVSMFNVHMFLNCWTVAMLCLSSIAVVALYRGNSNALFEKRFGPILIVFAINAASPYLGLKTGTSIAMWSNLNPTSRSGNHLLMPSSAFKSFSFVDDLAKIESSNLRHLQVNYVETDRLIAGVNLRRIIRETATKGGAQLELVFEKDGTRHVNPDATNSSLAAPEPYWQRKLVFVRDFSGTSTETCAW